ncbi:hypothetical protein F5B20DRAFT_134269 [Whalleya microplaca]|nr:hypothetical protein F5B20DRAFT_134269 [Whalleya microplaca]
MTVFTHIRRSSIFHPCNLFLSSSYVCKITKSRMRTLFQNSNVINVLYPFSKYWSVHIVGVICLHHFIRLYINCVLLVATHALTIHHVQMIDHSLTTMSLNLENYEYTSRTNVVSEVVTSNPYTKCKVDCHQRLAGLYHPMPYMRRRIFPFAGRVIGSGGALAVQPAEAAFGVADQSITLRPADKFSKPFSPEYFIQFRTSGQSIINHLGSE